MRMSKTEQTLDAFLVLDYRTGNKRALDKLVKRWHGRLCSRAYSYCRDYEQAKDIAQDSWKSIIFKLDNLKDPELFGSWALAIVTRRSIDWIRKEKRRRKRDEVWNNENTDTAEGDEGDAQIQIIKKAIQTLKPKHQEILRLYYTDGLLISTIASILGCSRGTVKSRLHHARNQLKLELNKKT